MPSEDLASLVATKALCKDLSQPIGEGHDINFFLDGSPKNGRKRGRISAETRAEAWAEKIAPTKAICQECPVRFECWYLGASEPTGVWGGLDPWDRVQLLEIKTGKKRALAGSEEDHRNELVRVLRGNCSGRRFNILEDKIKRFFTKAELR